MAYKIGTATVWNEMFSGCKTRIVTSIAPECNFPYICSDGSMWKNMQLKECQANKKFTFKRMKM